MSEYKGTLPLEDIERLVEGFRPLNISLEDRLDGEVSLRCPRLQVTENHNLLSSHGFSEAAQEYDDVKDGCSLLSERGVPVCGDCEHAMESVNRLRQEMWKITGEEPLVNNMSDGSRIVVDLDVPQGKIRFDQGQGDGDLIIGPMMVTRKSNLLHSHDASRRVDQVDAMRNLFQRIRISVNRQKGMTAGLRMREED